MTDEEKAEKYVNTHCCYYRQDFIRTYLDGLAEGRKEKWHDLRKEPNDLPNPNTSVLICFRFEKWTTTYIAYYRPAMKKWQTYNLLEAQREPITDDYIDSKEVIAWCEIPKFEE